MRTLDQIWQDKRLRPLERDRRRVAVTLIRASLDAVDPYRATRACLAQHGLRETNVLFAVGKAAAPMARAACDAMRVRQGLVTGPQGLVRPELESFQSAHPLPDDISVIAGKRALEIAAPMNRAQHALCLVSGGASAMWCVPKPEISLSRVRTLSQLLMRRSAGIAELNAVRVAMSAIKGGGLARALAPARVTTLVMSDVHGLPLHVVGSGPTLQAYSQDVSAETVLRRYGLWATLSDVERRCIAAPAPRFSEAGAVHLIADDQMLREGWLAAARAVGLNAKARPGRFRGEAKAVGAQVAALCTGLPWVWTGETTVDVRGSGVGGRNHELVLGAMLSGDCSGLLVSMGSDGRDGQSGAAGAFVDELVCRRWRSQGRSAQAALRDNDSDPFFRALGAQVITGPTGTNVGDLCFWLP